MFQCVARIRRRKETLMKQKCDVDRGEDLDSDDLTRDMDDPPSDTNLREVEMPKSGGGGGGQTGAGAARQTAPSLDRPPGGEQGQLEGAEHRR